MPLSSYFHPLTAGVIVLFYVATVLFEIIGGAFIHTFVRPKGNIYYNSLNWIVGWGIYIFIIFALGFFIAINTLSAIVTLLVLTTIALPIYRKRKIWQQSLSTWKSQLPVFILFFILIPLIFIEASRPPVEWDEMAYHFVPPLVLPYLNNYWNFSGSLYFDIPRSLNLYYIVSFAVSHTYSFARLTNFAFLFTAISYTYSALKEKFGIATSLLFVFALLSIPQIIIESATSGYVDIPTNAFVLIAVVSGVTAFLSKSKQYILISVIFWALALGTKYTALLALFPFAASCLILYLVRRKELASLITRRIFLALPVLASIFGGFWYIKNAYLFGNPIFPFFFKCKEAFSQACSQGANFFGTWTTEITKETLWPIFKEITGSNIVLIILTLLVPFFALHNKNKNTRTATLIILATIIIEFFVLSRFSGFLDRYHQHIQFMLMILITVQLANKYKSKLVAILARKIYVISILLLVPYYFYAVYFNYFNVNLRQDGLYALRRTSIYDWVSVRMPKVAEVVKWCEKQSAESPTPIIQIDPDMIWYRYEGLMRIFMTNCSFSSNVPLNDNGEISEGTQPFYVISLSECLPQGEVKPLWNFETEEAFRMRQQTNILICKGEKVVDSLYYVDTTK